MKSAYLIAGLVLVAPIATALPAFAKDKKEDAASKEPADPNKLVCRRVTPTGSMLSKKECHTKAEWSAAEDHARDQMDRNRQLQGGASLIRR